MSKSLRVLAMVTLIATSLSGHTVAHGAAHTHTDAALSPLVTAPARYVRPFIGTARYGNTFPGATMPFGMVQWSPDTQSRSPGGYTYADAALRGFSLTHLSGAGCPTYQDLPFLPSVGPLTAPPGKGGALARFSHADEAASPGYYRVRLASGIDVRLTATPRTGMAQFTYPKTKDATLLVDGGGSVNGVRAASLHTVGVNEIRGWVTSGDFCAQNSFPYTVYVDVLFNRPIRRIAAWDGHTLHPGAHAAQGPHAALALGFDASRDPVVLAKVGLSYVGVAGAQRNLRAENPAWDFEGVRQAATRAWNGMLGRIKVGGGTTTQTTLFYTALYHALLAPTICGDVDGEYRGLDGQVHHAQHYTQYSSVSGWDIYRGEAQLLSLLAPHEMSDMMRSLVADADQSGWLPRWLLANRSMNEMVGDPADPILADAYAFGVRGFDADSALSAMIKGATKTGVGPGGYVERPGLSDYLNLGYVPEVTHGLAGPVSITLEYALADFAIARLARAMGARETAKTFLQRSQNWRNLYNPATGYIQPRWPDGTFRPDFSPTSGWLYIEGNAVQYSWLVPYDLQGLIAAMGGDARVRARLDAFFTHLNNGPFAPYAWMGNEPSALVPWIYVWAGAPWRTQDVVRRIMTELYDPGPGGLPGNDDLGELSAWYVWAALGLYPAVPGTGVLVLHGPLFPVAHVSVPGIHLFTIIGQGAGVKSPYIQSVTLNGRAYTKTWLQAQTLRPGATLRFTLSSTPNRAWGTSPAARPPSFAPPATTGG